MTAGLLRLLGCVLILISAACSTQRTVAPPDSGSAAPALEPGTDPTPLPGFDTSDPQVIYADFATQSTAALRTAFDWDVTVTAEIERRSLIVDFDRLEQGGVNSALTAAESGILRTLADDVNALLDVAGHTTFGLTHVIVTSPEGTWPCPADELEAPFDCIAGPLSGEEPLPLPPIVD